MTISARSFDVFIVGAGPAGSSLAIRLASAGLQVAIAEQKKFPRHKLCGEFVSPECSDHFEELGLTTSLAATTNASLRETVFYSYAGRSVSIGSEVFGARGTPAIGLSRSRMDEMLLERASNVGVEVFSETAANAVIRDEQVVTGVEVSDRSGQKFVIDARLTVDATGRSRQLVKKVTSLTQSKPTLTAFKTHLEGAEPAKDTCEIYSYPGGYGGLSSVGDSYNLCFVNTSAKVREIGNDPEILMRKIVMLNPRAAKTLKHARVVEPWLAVAIDRFGTVEPAPAVGLIAIGDAASFIDPFTGSGILMALESSRLAAGSVRDSFHDLKLLNNEYAAAYRDRFSDRLRYTKLLRYASNSTSLAEFAVVALRSSGYLRTRVALATRG